jgi:hypothetical protein
LESIKRLNAAMKSQMDEHKTALTRCEEKMKGSQKELGLDLVHEVKEQLRHCRGQVDTLTASTQRTKDDSRYQNTSKNGGEKCGNAGQDHCRINLEKSLNLLKSCQSQLRNFNMDS